MTVKRIVREILEMLSESTVQLCWIPGETISSDLVSKLFQDPFTQTNSYLFPFGTECSRTNEMKYILFEVTNPSERYFLLHDEILAVERKKVKSLIEAGKEESFGHKEVDKLQCIRCSGDETNCEAVMRMRSKAMAE